MPRGHCVWRDPFTMRAPSVLPNISEASANLNARALELRTLDHVHPAVFGSCMFSDSVFTASYDLSGTHYLLCEPSIPSETPRQRLHLGTFSSRSRHVPSDGAPTEGSTGLWGGLGKDTEGFCPAGERVNDLAEVSQKCLKSASWRHLQRPAIV